ncbi:thyrotropin-releasing hormone-degrading ectoenzyme-like isoform X1 [Dreissena polymorpha]|uniref:thyrotropin-releasing hormone-degrading ectoenzyme-like isoform X1 n=2 Tax=Dreissena polymorpha TaxID=45954 RepID=UPI0022648EDD|nr:thyrotropin-releasing hormone-degrading ectoenzyme-like isoform X1 [Dreissena polymorpha]
MQKLFSLICLYLSIGLSQAKARSDYDAVAKECTTSLSDFPDIRLPGALRPERYHLDIVPSTNGPPYIFHCTTTIILICNEPTEYIRLHSLNQLFLSIRLELLPDDYIFTNNWTHAYQHETDISNHTSPFYNFDTFYEFVKGRFVGTQNSEVDQFLAGNSTIFEELNKPNEQNEPNGKASKTEREISGYSIISCSQTPHEMIEMQVNKPLTTGRVYKLELKTMSIITSDSIGLYHAAFTDKVTGAESDVLTTMFEPTRARYVFPCFDEPDFKAVFTATITRAENKISIMNLPRRMTLGPDANGNYVDVFDEPRDVRMSTYLLTFAIGEFDSIEGNYNDIQTRVFGHRSFINDAQLILDVTKLGLEFFEHYFQIPYVFPKLDSVVVPKMDFGGMEHWGLVTYNRKAAIFENIDSYSFVNLNTLVAHEVAHQWFGNLVSPSWWDDLWLNEGFATYMMYFAMDKMSPDLQIADLFFTSPVRGIHEVMTVDQKNNSHPIYVPVKEPQEIEEIFDVISYAKGGAVIKMMAFFLGEGTFQNGLKRYLIKHSFSTASHNDLWVALSEQAKEDGLPMTDVKSVMDTWILEPHYPVVMVTIADDMSSVCFEQSVFVETAGQESRADDVIWQIPIACTSATELDFEKGPDDIMWLQEKRQCFAIDILAPGDWLLCNVKQEGFYRVNYSLENWRRLTDQLNLDHTVIHSINRAQLINDAWELNKMGHVTASVALETLEYLEKEAEYLPWKTASLHLEYLDQLLQLSRHYGQFRIYMKSKLERVYCKSSHRSTLQQRMLHRTVTRWACEFDLPSCIQDMLDIYTAHVQDENIQIEADILNTVFCVAEREGQYVPLSKRKEAPFQNEVDAEMLASGCVRTPWEIMESLDFQLHQPFPNKGVLDRLTATPTGRLVATLYMLDRWPDIANMSTAEPYTTVLFVQELVEKISTQWELQQAKNVLNIDDVGRAILVQQKGLITARINYWEEIQDEVISWLYRPRE